MPSGPNDSPSSGLAPAFSSARTASVLPARAWERERSEARNGAEKAMSALRWGNLLRW